MFLSSFSPAILAKLHFSRQRYCFFRTYASAKRIFLIKSYISPLFSSPISLPFGQISPAFTLYFIFPAFTPYTIHQPITSPHKMTRIIHFFAAKLAYINQKHYFCNGKAIFPLTNDVNKLLRQLWNTNLVLAVVLHLFVSTIIPLSANAQASYSLLLRVPI